ncbi:MAG: hypothetical protein CM15mV72_510 [uncultured marine virus]|nr:MAG: hypothetical protein CM15mV72_510 [uncultured marine virus]
MKVPAPKGYHWMKSGNNFKLMKDLPVDLNHTREQLSQLTLQFKNSQRQIGVCYGLWNEVV